MKNLFRLFVCFFFSMNISIHSQWYALNFPSHWSLKNASFTDASNGFLVSQGQSKLFITNNGSGSWDSVTFGGLTVDVEFISPDTGFVLIDSSGKFLIKATTNGGNTWRSDSLPSDYYNMIRFTDPNNGFAAANFGSIYHTTDGGNSWIPLTMGGYSSATDKELIGPDTIIFTGWDGSFAYQGSVMRRDGVGTFQERIMNTTYSQFNGSYFLNGQEGYAVFTRNWPSHKNYLVHTIDGGTSWDTVLTDTTSTVQFNDVWMSDTAQGIIVGTDIWTGTHGAIYHFSGTTYFLEYGVPSPLNRIYMAGNTLWALGDNGEIYATFGNAGLESETEELKSIYPNPTSDLLKIPLDLVSEVSLINMRGQIMMKRILSPGDVISVKELTAGIYTILVTNEKGRSASKIIVEK